MDLSVFLDLFVHISQDESVQQALYNINILQPLFSWFVNFNQYILIT